MRNGALAGLRRRSPVHGLDRRNLRPVEVLAQSVSTAAPAAGMATVPAIVATTAGTATVWSFVLATAVALAVGACIATFTRRMAAAGSLYSLTAKGLGPGAAFACGAALLAGYAVLLMAALAGAALYTDAFLTRLGLAAPPAVGAATVVVLAALAGGLVLRGVRVSARIVLAVEAVSITVMLVIFGVLLAGPPAPPAPAAATPGWSLVGVAAGVLPALGAFIGFEAATALGVEARKPFVSVPRAVLGTAGLVGLLSLLAAHTQVVGFAGALGGQPEPVVTLAAAHGTPWLAVLLDLGIATSFVACTLATTNALVRVLFSMARDRIVPRPMGATHGRYRTPHVAIAVAVPVGAAVPAALFLAGVPGLTVLRGLLSVATAGYLVAYLLVALAAPLFLHRIGELTPAPVVVTALAVPVLAGVCGVFVVSALGGAVPIVLGALVLAALAWYAVLRVRRPRELAAIGVYDEPSAADVHTASGPAGRAR
ncbi:amino acid/polyamine/organocation transporter (APC superfamily) [Pseudonocardia hierapolitana]|uniref:Amino acid/polyamine/organocation transporter (APC superfamily) n=1 Tax=Pseudonocardia hierapolitana TaxID=1128676 RepID=A0A561T2C8_9PSEU|nr:APC family permease [Pseudonocardia hierapolitana]TWF81245.1 amino acid/polyamine/organocation transporter (APC superfamily) [Pseudonocardia hierapolitana]